MILAMVEMFDTHGRERSRWVGVVIPELGSEQVLYAVEAAHSCLAPRFEVKNIQTFVLDGLVDFKGRTLRIQPYQPEEE